MRGYLVGGPRNGTVAHLDDTADTINFADMPGRYVLRRRSASATTGIYYYRADL